jgi:predicted RNase H-like HicB family nuclease
MLREEVAEAVSYTVKIERDESGAWIARVPEVPGCHTYGRSLRQVKGRIREALALWVDNADRTELVFDIRLPSEIRQKVSAARRARETAHEAQRHAQETAGLSALALVKRHRLSVRDAAELLGISHQRVQQLVDKPPKFEPDPRLIGELERGA